MKDAWDWEARNEMNGDQRSTYHQSTDQTTKYADLYAQDHSTFQLPPLSTTPSYFVVWKIAPTNFYELVFAQEKENEEELELDWVGLIRALSGSFGLLPFLRNRIPYSPVRENQTERRDGETEAALADLERDGEMEAALADLERVQTQILERMSKLELSHLPNTVEPLPSSSPLANADVEGRLSNILRSNGVKDFLFKRVPSDYYDWPLESRRDVLGAASVHHLCKSIVLVNTQAQSNVIDCSDRNNSKYYVVVVQYTARFNAETVKNFLYAINNGKISKKKFNLRLAPDETSIKLTGYEHNAVTCIGMQTDIPEEHMRP
ncbi:hypothetical protein PTKIN_Ptkin05aG0034300 [Pterospermum kingtungense]